MWNVFIDLVCGYTETKSHAEFYQDVIAEYDGFQFESAENNGYTYVSVTGGNTVVYRNLQQTLSTIEDQRKELADKLQTEVGIPKVRFYIKMINGDTNEKSTHAILFENGQVQFDK
ncbi:hypothetical protein CN514_24555 [Bacillus sp. AFS001701]|uniref:hypothetical protein n=1 Tax=Bacillaceae TaxID=186817 RepID=UPI000BF9B96F|nr:hypothetical protein [Bacillus sp. AFS001701]PET36593.1 hypothetical protein CN514_24555 [Bacillus sp. AFS001701]